MFKKNKKQPEPTNPAVVLSPIVNQDSEQENQQPVQEQPVQEQKGNPLAIPQMENPLAIPQQPVQQPVQQQQQLKPEAVIIQTYITEDQTYRYLVETNYPLNLGVCQLVQ